MTLVVSDNSPLSLLVHVGCQDILPRLFQHVVVPTVVAQELAHPAAPVSIREFIHNPPDWFTIQEPHQLLALAELDAGESAAISLALELKAPLLIDERAGRRIAKQYGLDIIGAVGILERAADMGLITDLSDIHDKILKLKFHIDPAILAGSLARHLSQRHGGSLE